MTERLFYKDPYQTNFTSTIVEKITKKHEGKQRTAVVLAATLFYPTSGGQPNDLGTLGKEKKVNVIDVIEEKHKIVHILEEDVDAQVGEEVSGTIDWERRLDHMQQHHGQHILSAAFIQVANIPTLAFHMSKNVSNIDLDTQNLTEELIVKVQAYANQCIVGRKPVSTQNYTLEEAKKLPLRKTLDSGMEEPIRIVSIQDVDMQPCCGTHPHTTAEVQAIVITGYEKVKKTTRLYFVCGQRVIQQAYQQAKTLKSIATKLTSPVEEVEKAFDTYVEANNQARKQLADYEKVVYHNMAKELQPEQIKGFSVYFANYQDKDMKVLRAIAKDDLFAKNSVLCLFSLNGTETSALLAASDDTKLDLRPVFKELGAKFNGKGGGQAQFVTGNLKNNNVSQMIEECKSLLLK